MNNLVGILLMVCAAGVVFLLFFLFALLRDMSRITRYTEGSAAYKNGKLNFGALIREKQSGAAKGGRMRTWAAAIALAACAASQQPQSTGSDQNRTEYGESIGMPERIKKWACEVSELKSMGKQLQSASPRSTKAAQF
jgi:Na+-transporting methylmalonyl-CoA/oxaloacetate decarboxylase gamma subunit